MLGLTASNVGEESLRCVQRREIVGRRLGREPFERIAASAADRAGRPMLLKDADELPGRNVSSAWSASVHQGAAESKRRPLTIASRRRQGCQGCGLLRAAPGVSSPHANSGDHLNAVSVLATPLRLDARMRGSQVTDEDRLRRGRHPLRLAPTLPRVPRASSRSRPGADDTLVADEGGDRARQVGQVAHGIDRGARRLEVPPCEEIVQTFEAPVEDPRRLLEQFVGEAWVFASEEALREDENDEARGERSRGIGEAGGARSS